MSTPSEHEHHTAATHAAYFNRRMSQVANFSPSQIRSAVNGVEGFNAKVALVITNSVGTMACAYVFTVITLISLPATISSGSVLLIVQWVAQTFLQLVLLSVIMVGQRVQGLAADERALKTFRDVEDVLDKLDTKTQGGLKDILDAVESLRSQTA
jgi:hypothetical protein